MKTKSFTLIELLVVIVIIGILAGVITISVTSNINKAQDAKVSGSMLSISKIIKSDLYNSFPIETTACNLKDSCSTLKSQLDIPNTGEDIYYKTSASGKFFVLYSDKPSDSSRSFEITSLDENVKEVPSYDNLVAYYPLAQDTSNQSNIISDMSSNSNNGTNYGAGFAKGPDGNMGTAMSFDGSNDYIDIGSDNSLHFGTNSFSISFWMESITIKDFGGLFRSGDSTNGIACYSEGTSNVFRCWIRTSNTSFNLAYSFTDINPFDNDWHHIVFLVDRSSNYATVYWDGAKSVNNFNISSAGDIASYDFEIGRQSGPCFNGLIDDFRIYNRALSENEINLLYNK